MINFKHNIKTLYTVFKRIKSKMIFRDKKYTKNLSISIKSINKTFTIQFYLNNYKKFKNFEIFNVIIIVN